MNKVKKETGMTDEIKHKRLELIHDKFKIEHQCTACGGYFLDPDKSVERCPRCVRLNRVARIKAPGDVLFKDVNVTELSKQVAELQAKILSMSKDKEPELVEEKKPRTFKPKPCAGCDKEFTPQSPAQKICDSCREELIS